MIGNFIADGVKGKRYNEYEKEIATGILMHRAIDTFTDSNEIVKHSKSFFREKYGLYASVVVDLFYDHFLAANWKIYSEVSLAEFAAYCYQLFRKYFDSLPPRYQHMLPYMEKENWLLNYGNADGIQRSLTGMSKRINHNPGIEHALTEFKIHYAALDHDFRSFFPQLQHDINLRFPPSEQ